MTDGNDSSSVVELPRVEDRLQGIGGVGEPCRPCESERQLGHDQMRFEHGKAIVTVPDRLLQNAGNLAAPLAGRNVAMQLGIVVLDVKMLDMRPQETPGLVDRLANLEVIG